MHAITLSQFGDPEVMHYSEVPTPEPGPGELLIEVVATSVNRPDIIQRQGNYPPPPGDSEILGLEVAGLVSAVGENVKRFQPGSVVFGLVGGGGYAEYCIAREDHCMPIPKGLSFVEAACICETYITAWLNLFRIGEVDGKQSVLIHGGGGGVTTAGIQLCRALTPETKIYVTASTSKLKRVREQGADRVIDYRKQSFVDEVRRYTKNRGVDVVLDHIGAEYLTDNLRSLARGGSLILIGVMRGIKAEVNLATLMVKRQRIIGSVLRSRPTSEKGAIIADFERTVLPLLAQGLIKPEISATFALREAADAHRMMEKSRHFGKIVLTTD